jgi:hypothetical protein
MVLDEDRTSRFGSARSRDHPIREARRHHPEERTLPPLRALLAEVGCDCLTQVRYDHNSQPA